MYLDFFLPPICFLPCVGKHRGSPNVEATVYLAGIQGHVMMHTEINNKRAVRAVSDDSQVIPRDLQWSDAICREHYNNEWFSVRGLIWIVQEIKARYVKIRDTASFEAGVHSQELIIHALTCNWWIWVCFCSDAIRSLSSENNDAVHCTSTAPSYVRKDIDGGKLENACCCVHCRGSVGV